MCAVGHIGSSYPIAISAVNSKAGMRKTYHPRPPSAGRHRNSHLEAYASPLPAEACGRHDSCCFLASAPKLVQDRIPVKLAQCTILLAHNYRAGECVTLIMIKAALDPAYHSSAL